MKNMLSYAAAAAVLVLLIILLNLYRKPVQRHTAFLRKQAERERRQSAAKKAGLLVSCPLCGTPLLPGEDLVSRVYRPMNVPDQLCTISGCPHCYPSVEPGLCRTCPVCRRTVPLKGGQLIARLFNKAEGKKHVIVTGCKECSRGAK